MQVLGVHDLGQSFNAAMYLPRRLSWLREDENNRPWRDWRVPIASRPSQGVRWRDVIVLDENNEFVAVQNLSDEPLNFGPGRTLLTNVIRSTATISDTDIDGLPDRWEFQHFDGIGTAAEQTTAAGLPALLSYAVGGDPTAFDPAARPRVSVFHDDGDRYLQLEFRRRLAGEGERLQYIPETSTDGGATWSEAPAGAWVEVSAEPQWDGTGTELALLRTADPITPGEDKLVRLRVSSPL